MVGRRRGSRVADRSEDASRVATRRSASIGHGCLPQVFPPRPPQVWQVAVSYQVAIDPSGRSPDRVVRTVPLPLQVMHFKHFEQFGL